MKESSLRKCDQKSIKEEMQHELDLNEGEDVGKKREQEKVVWMEEHLKENIWT